MNLLRHEIRKKEYTQQFNLLLVQNDTNYFNNAYEMMSRKSTIEARRVYKKLFITL